MTVTARFFAVLRERMGQAATQVQMAPDATVAMVWETIVAQHPELRDLRGATHFAVNGRYATPETHLHDGDEVAFLPPMSGGGV